MNQVGRCGLRRGTHEEIISRLRCRWRFLLPSSSSSLSAVASSSSFCSSLSLPFISLYLPGELTPGQTRLTAATATSTKIPVTRQIQHLCSESRAVFATSFIKVIVILPVVFFCQFTKDIYVKLSCRSAGAHHSSFQ